MKNILALSVLMVFLAGSARAGSEYDRCIKEEKALKAQETAECSGLRYLLNPSACYATQRLLKEYKGGKCRQIGIAEQVDFTAQAVAPEKMSAPPAVAPAVKTERTATAGPAAVAPAISSPAVPGVVTKSEPVTIPQGVTIEQLREENARLKAEISRLKAENEQLRKPAR